MKIKNKKETSDKISKNTGDKVENLDIWFRKDIFNYEFYKNHKDELSKWNYLFNKADRIIKKINELYGSPKLLMNIIKSWHLNNYADKLYLVNYLVEYLETKYDIQKDDKFMIYNELIEYRKTLNQTVVEDFHEKEDKKAEQFHFDANFPVEKLGSLLINLKKNNIIKEETIQSHFNFAICGIEIPKGESSFARIVWTAKSIHSKNDHPNKKALIDFLSILGVYENHITQENINFLFKTLNGVNFKSGNFKYDNGKLVTKSEYHETLSKIIEDSKKEQNE